MASIAVKYTQSNSVCYAKDGQVTAAGLSPPRCSQAALAGLQNPPARRELLHRAGGAALHRAVQNSCFTRGCFKTLLLFFHGNGRAGSCIGGVGKALMCFCTMALSNFFLTTLFFHIIFLRECCSQCRALGNYSRFHSWILTVQMLLYFHFLHRRMGYAFFFSHLRGNKNLLFSLIMFFKKNDDGCWGL